MPAGIYEHSLFSLSRVKSEKPQPSHKCQCFETPVVQQIKVFQLNEIEPIKVIIPWRHRTFQMAFSWISLKEKQVGKRLGQQL